MPSAAAAALRAARSPRSRRLGMRQAVAPAALLTALAAIGCADEPTGIAPLAGPRAAVRGAAGDSAADSVASSAELAVAPPVAEFAGPSNPAAPLALVRCTVVVGPTPGLSCTSSAPGGYVQNGSTLIVGGQGAFVAVASTGGSLADGTLVVNATVRNLIYQALGTTDGVKPDPAGVRLVLVGAPVVTAGTGKVTAVGDGVATFTAADQPYWQYNTVLGALALTGPKGLTFQLTGAVSTYRIDLLVAAAVPHPTGSIEVAPAVVTLPTAAQQPLVTSVRDAVGGTIADAKIVWSTSNPLAAAVGAATGTVTGVRAGEATVTATSGTRSGTAQVTVLPTTRSWTGALGTAWDVGGNWAGGLVPAAQDSALIPAGPKGPVLAQNTQIAGLTIADGATIALGAYDLTASGDVVAGGLTGGVEGVTGRLILSGTARTVRGNVPRLLVGGTYTLSGTLRITRQLHVSAGRLTDGAYLIRVDGY